MLKKTLFLALLAVSVFFPRALWARENVMDWYIKDFDTRIVVNKDSSLDITETITADCGTGLNKHGIFRILPTRINLPGQRIETPIKLLSITNSAGINYNYATTTNSQDGTVTWKIGDAARTVQGVNVYIIHYQVRNAIRFDNSATFDELYWNLNGNFWDLETDKFRATILFPQEVNSQNATVEYYTGYAGSKDKSLATYRWSAPNVLEFNATKTLLARQGITTSVTFPKHVFTPYQASLWEKYGQYLFLLLPILVFVVAFRLWWKYGKDPKVDKAVIPEYEAPGNLSPLELGMLAANGKMKNSLVTAELINLAVKGIISIKEVESKILFFSSRDYELTRVGDAGREQNLNDAQKKILEAVFEEEQVVSLSSLKNKFYTKLPKIKLAGETLLKGKKLISPSGLNYAYGMSAAGAFFVFLGIVTIAGKSDMVFLMISLLLTGGILFLFGLVMPRRTQAGAELNWEIKGFKLFMKTVDKDRAQFYEKENIFEKFLPYAIVFDITELWIERMKLIYGEEFYATYAPAWYAGNLAHFDAGSLNSLIGDLSADIAASTESPSGAGGSGGSGGGGGGGGGGGW